MAYRFEPNWLRSCCEKIVLSRLWMAALPIAGSTTKTFGPKSGVWPGGVVGCGSLGEGSEPSLVASRNDCAAVPLQVYCCSWTLSAVAAAGTSRHLPLCRLTKWYVPPDSATACHCWLFP